jgi:hypothetical protein
MILMQLATPDAMRGWAGALNSPFIGAYNVQSYRSVHPRLRERAREGGRRTLLPEEVAARNCHGPAGHRSD